MRENKVNRQTKDVKEKAQQRKIHRSDLAARGAAAAVMSQTAWKGFPTHHLSFTQREVSADNQPFKHKG